MIQNDVPDASAGTGSRPNAYICCVRKKRVKNDKNIYMVTFEEIKQLACVF